MKPDTRALDIAKKHALAMVEELSDLPQIDIAAGMITIAVQMIASALCNLPDDFRNVQLALISERLPVAAKEAREQFLKFQSLSSQPSAKNVH